MIQGTAELDIVLLCLVVVHEYGLARSWLHTDQGNKEVAWEQFLLAVEGRSWFTGLRAAALCQHKRQAGQGTHGSLSCSITSKFLLNHRE